MHLKCNVKGPYKREAERNVSWTHGEGTAEVERGEIWRRWPGGLEAQGLRPEARQRPPEARGGFCPGALGGSVTRPTPGTLISHGSPERRERINPHYFEPPNVWNLLQQYKTDAAVET